MIASGRRRSLRGRIRLGLAAALAMALATAMLLPIACSDPDRAILARLDEAERARFRSGRAVAAPCWTCHDLAGRVKKVGPSLLGLYGRRAGQAPAGRTSQALRDSGIVWNDRTLARFLQDPAGTVPGNAMVSPGVRDPAALRDLLFYLRHVTRPGAREPGPAETRR